jgi:hypothetical protein
MAGIRTTPTDVTPNFWAEDFTQTVNTLLANDAGIVQMLFGNANMLISGCALSAAAGMGVNVAAGQATANGVILPIGANTVTLAAGNTQPRYDVIYALLGTTVGSNGTSGQPTAADSATLGVTTGTPAGSPTVPALPSANYVQLGTVYVPANATTSAGCTLNSQVTAPNAQGPLKTLVDLLVHVAANVTNAVTVHGIRQGAGNGFDADMVDGSHATAFDASGAAATVQTNLTTEVTNRTNAVSSEATTRAAADTTLTNNLNGHTAQSIYTGITHGAEFRRGHATGISINSGMGNVQVATITFSPAMSGTPQCITLTMDAANPGGAPAYAPPAAVTNTGFQIWMSTAGTYTGGVYWRADS